MHRHSRIGRAGLAGAWSLVTGLVAAWAVAFTVAGCGGGGAAAAPASPPPAVNAALEIGNSTAFATVLQAVPADADGGGTDPGSEPTRLSVHYRRAGGDYAGWQLHTWGAAADPGWNQGWDAARSDAFGVVYDVPLASPTGSVGYLFHKGDAKDHGGADQAWTLAPGANALWRVEGDPVTYTSEPGSGPAPAVTTLRVHYKRYDGRYAAWGLHLWNGSGLDVARLPAGLGIDRWSEPVPFERLPGWRAGDGEIVFDLPVLDPRANPQAGSVEFIVHGMPPAENDKDGRAGNIRVDYAGLAAPGGVADVWLVQQDPSVHLRAPDLRHSSLAQARAVWLDRRLVQWPRVDDSGSVKLYASAGGQIRARVGEAVRGHDIVLALDAWTAPVPAALAERFKWVGAGAVFALREADLPRLVELHRQQLVLVQEDAAGKVRNATTAQVAGALDDLYAGAAGLRDLGATAGTATTRFRLWAPTARKVSVFTYAGAHGAAETVDDLVFDAATGSWSVERPGRLVGKPYRYAVEVFVRGVGVVRNLVTDPYALGLTADSRRAVVVDLDDPATQPAGWAASLPPATVEAAPDMAIYELHLRDFSARDASVPAAQRGKYLAFTQASSLGMQHLARLAGAGITDVHLLPAFDFATVPEAGCLADPVIPAAAPDAELQQAAAAAAAAGDCFNWGYDPWHFTVPEGSYASDADDALARVREFRTMVKALHDAGLRVGMDVVYNHTTASGQNERSLLDRIVPGYYHRLDDKGAVTTSTCCDNTASENLMMGKLVSDSVLTWARDYRIASFRFDIMGHQPRALMEALKARLRQELGREVQLIGEGWNFGEVADGARFVQASMGSLAGSGIGSFNSFLRDAARGGSPFDGGDALVARQGWLNGLHYDPNARAAAATPADLAAQADLVRAALAGSIRSLPLLTHDGSVRRLEELGGAGYVVDPAEVVNYVENHDNLTLFDTNALRLPAGTSRAERARVQILGAALVAFAQGVPYFHAGVDTLRSKSLDRNSYDAGDWFNRLDWTLADNGFGSGLPRQADNGANWPTIRPFLADASIKPAPADIAWTHAAFLDLLRIRASTTMLRLPSAEAIAARLSFLGTGPGQTGSLVALRIDGAGLEGARFREIVVAVNADKVAHSVTSSLLAGKPYVLHPVLAAAGAADARARTARFDADSGTLVVPARTALAFVVP